MNTFTTFVAGALLASAAAGQAAIYEVDAVSALAAGADDTRALLAADLDHDGDQDLLVSNYGQANVLLDNRGDGKLTVVPSTVVTLPTDNTFGVAAGDIDGDGDVDLAFAHGAGQNNGLFRNDGPPSSPWVGRFTDLSPDPVTQGGGDSYAALFADLDGDGDLDLAFANRDISNFVYRNDGSGAFLADVSGPVVNDVASSRALASGDLDGDGDEDLVFANSNDESNFIYINQGGAQAGVEGEFVALAGDPAVNGSNKSFGVSLADWNNDGDLDLFVANRKDQTNELFSNDGSGAFSLASSEHPAQDAGDSFSGTFGDADGDGDVDLFVANRNQANFFYLNNGSSLVRRTTGPVVAGADDSRAGVFVDLDSDGTNELAVGNTNGQANALFRNLLSHWVDLGAAHQPVPGNEVPRLSAAGDLSDHSWVRYYIDSGVASASAALVVGVSQINAPFRGGVLVPSPDLLLEGLNTNAMGHLRLSFIVPGILPSGLTLYHQVWIVDGAAPAGLVATNGLRGTTP